MGEVFYMRSIQKLTKEEMEVKELIASLKNTLTEIPYDFEYDSDDEDDRDINGEEYYD